MMSDEIEQVVEGPEAPASDRRQHPRYKFAALISVLDSKSGRRIETQLGDLSLQGCYVATKEPFPLGTATTLRITRGAVSCDADARVVFSREKSGMGLLFTDVEPDRAQILSTWVSDARENAWLALSRRRSQRVLLRVPLMVFGQNALGAPFEEKTETTTVSAHGALLLLSKALDKGQPISLASVQTKAAAECIVVHIGEVQGSQVQIGVEFVLPSPAFWHVSFPPKDWSLRHPDAKGRVGL
jgi:hypothetical protein